MGNFVIQKTSYSNIETWFSKCYDKYGGHHAQKLETHNVLDSTHRRDSLCPIPQPVCSGHLRYATGLLGNHRRLIHTSHPIHFAGNRHRSCLALGMGWSIDLRRLVCFLYGYCTGISLERLRDHRGNSVCDWGSLPTGLDLQQRDTTSVRQPIQHCSHHS